MDKKNGSEKLSSLSKPKRLKSFSSTDHLLELNIKRARFQPLAWLSCLEENPPNLDPCEVNKNLLLTPLCICQYIVHIEHYINMLFSFTF